MNLKDFLPIASQIAKNQGFTVLVLSIFVCLMAYLDYQRRQADINQIKSLEMEVRECTQTVIEYYQTDHELMINAIKDLTNSNNHLIQELKNR